MTLEDRIRTLFGQLLWQHVVLQFENDKLRAELRKQNGTPDDTVAPVADEKESPW